jgi:hypothetical protein
VYFGLINFCANKRRHLTLTHHSTPLFANGFHDTVVE